MTGSSRENGDRPAPVSIRMSAGERAALAARAGELPVSAYIREVLFGDGQGQPRVRQDGPDRQLSGRVLAMLGKSGLATTLQSMALMAATGVLYVDEETEAYLRRACEDVRELRDLLMRSLGKEPPRPTSAEEAFRNAAEPASRVRTRGH